MAVKDIRSNLVVQTAVFNAISADGTVTGNIIDTKGYSLGVMFTLAAPVYTDGSYAVAIVQGDDPALADAEALDPAQVLGAYPTLVAVTGAGENYFTVGVINNKRYLRIDVTATTVTTGATISSDVVLGAQYLPTQDNDDAGVIGVN